MLTKLIKYEFKATGRFFGMLFGLMAALSVLFVLMIKFEGTGADLSLYSLPMYGSFDMFAAVVFALFMLVYAVVSAVCLTAIFFYSIVRFRNNLLGNEGYLSHMLPVKAIDHILAKNLISVLWSVLSLLTLFACLSGVVIFGVSEVGFTEFLDFIDGTVTLFFTHMHTDYRIAVIIPEVFMLILVNVAKYYMQIYTAMSVGYSFNKHRGLISIGVFILIRYISSFVQLPISMGDSHIHLRLLAEIVISIIWAAVYAFIANWFLTKRLNLQ